MDEAAMTREKRNRLSEYDQMLDAQQGCVPCKLCGGTAIITDAGLGCGYYVKCSNSLTFREYKGCLLDGRRLGGWAYNVMDWWNRLHRTPPQPSGGEVGRAYLMTGPWECDPDGSSPGIYVHDSAGGDPICLATIKRLHHPERLRAALVRSEEGGR